MRSHSWSKLVMLLAVVLLLGAVPALRLLGLQMYRRTHGTRLRYRPAQSRDCSREHLRPPFHRSYL